MIGVMCRWFGMVGIASINYKIKWNQVVEFRGYDIWHDGLGM